MGGQMEYWFTVGSTYNYLTVNRIEALAEVAGVALALRPFYLGHIFREIDAWPFKDGSPKTAYMWRDIERQAARLGLAPKMPPPYPCPETDRANRIAQLTIERGMGLAWIKASYRAWYEEGLMAGSAENLAQSLPAAGLDPEEVIALADGTDGTLMAATDEARAKGLFGAPSFIAGGELYWGNDRLEEAVAAAC